MATEKQWGNSGHGNLTPWKPGQSGNPAGRPKGRSLTSILREVLDRDEINGVPIADGKRVADLFIEAAIGHAMSGNATVIKEVFERIDGKVMPTEEEAGATVRDALAKAEAALANHKPDERPDHD